jgi:ubiquilin
MAGKVVIKLSNATTTEVAVESFTQTVLTLKETIEIALTIPVNQQRLIFRGKVLKDENSLEFYEIADGLTIHLVKGAAKPAEGTFTAATPTSVAATPPTTTSMSTAPTNPFAAFGGAGMGMGGPPPMDMNQMQQEIMRNPQMMQQMMNSPMMQGMLDNPDMLREIMMSNPQMQAMLDSNPQVRHVLNDPSVCVTITCYSKIYVIIILLFYHITSFSFLYIHCNSMYICCIYPCTYVCDV